MGSLLTLSGQGISMHVLALLFILRQQIALAMLAVALCWSIWGSGGTTSFLGVQAWQLHPQLRAHIAALLVHTRLWTISGVHSSRPLMVASQCTVTTGTAFQPPRPMQSYSTVLQGYLAAASPQLPLGLHRPWQPPIVCHSGCA